MKRERKTQSQASGSSEPKKYDFIIIGAGVAGLALAYELVNSSLDGHSILLVDRVAKTKNDRTLSFWSTRPTPFDEVVYHSWQRINFASEDFEKKFDLQGYAYKTIRGIDFYRFVQEKLAAHPEVEFVQGRVETVIDSKVGAYIVVNEQLYFGKWLFDSRLKPFEFKHEPSFGKQVLRQYFKGWIVETQLPAFDPNCATLFDFRVPQEGDMRFFYVLPFSEREALVEYVGLEHTDYDAIMESYIDNVLKLKDYRLKPLEGGAILLTDRKFERRSSRHVLLIGAAGGMIKPSSGYAFTRILQDTEAIVNSLVKYGHPFRVRGVNAFYRFLDSQMLEVMNRFTGKMKTIFTAMFKYNSAPRIFRFLDEATSVGEIVALIVSMPLKPLFVWTVLTDEKRSSLNQASS